MASLLAVSGAACADTQGSWFAGGLLEEDLSGHGGVTLGLFDNPGNNGFAARLSGYTSQYQYLSGATRIHGQDSGGQLTGLFQWSGDWGYADAGAGVRYMSVNLSPTDPANTRRGSRADAGLVTDGAYFSNPWRVDWYGEYGVDQRAYYARTGLSHAVDAEGRWHLGVEGGYQGDMYYDRSSVGGLAIVDFENGIEARLSAGATFQPRREDSGYVALTISQSF